MIPKQIFVAFLYFSSVLSLPACAMAQLAMPKLEAATTTVDDNPTDTLSTFDGTLGMNLSQTSLANWAGGGESALAFTALCQMGQTKEQGPSSTSWALDAALGLLHQSDTWRKTDDRLVLSGQWNSAIQTRLRGGRLSALVDARTQFLPGYAVVGGVPDKDQRISDFLSPGYLVAAAGFAPKKGENQHFFVAPVTGKLTVLLDDTLAAAGAFGVGAGQSTRLELGGYIRWNLKMTLMENVTWTHQVDLFSNYMNQPGNIDVNWTGLLELTINESLRTTISTHLIYDDDVVLEKESAVLDDQGGIATPAKFGPGTQFKEVLSVGFSYKL